MENKRIPRISLNVRVALLFFGAAFMILMAVFFVNYRYQSNTVTAECRAEVHSAASVVGMLLCEFDPDLKLLEDEALRGEMEMIIRKICKEYELKYLYLYRINENRQRVRIISTASDDKDQRFLNETAGFGTLSTNKLRPIELAILDGKSDGGYELVNNQYGVVLTWNEPYTNSKDEMVAMIGADYAVDNVEAAVNDNLFRGTLVIVVLLLATGVTTIFLMEFFVLRPLRQISDSMEHFVRDRRVPNLKRNAHRNDEISDIEKSFGKMAADIRKYLGDIEDLTTKRLETEVQLSAARRIQNGVMPQVTSLSGFGYSAYAIEQPAKEVGGDFYDLFVLPDGRIRIVAADVSGKGIAAALFMMVIRRLIRDHLQGIVSPAEALNTVNDELCRENPEGMFATVFAGIYDKESGKLVYANAGHTPPVFFGKESGILSVEPGIALGLFEDAGIRDEELALSVGQGLILYTDGVSEAVDSNKCQFGEERLVSIMNSRFKNAGEAAESLKNAVMEFSRGMEQFDDLTIVSIFREQDIMPLPAELSGFDLFKERIFQELPATTGRNRLLMACEEWFVNIVSYSGATEIGAELQFIDSGWVVVFIDNGAAFDLTAYESGEKDFEDFDSGGMGIDMIRDIASQITYRREDDRNIVKLVFSFADQV